MYGQYRSVVDCPKCEYHSIQFDPFLVCSLPLLNSDLKKMEIKFVNNHYYMSKVTICYEKSWGWKMKDAFAEISKKLKLEDNI